MINSKLLRLFTLPILSLQLIVGNTLPSFGADSNSRQMQCIKKLKELSGLLNIEKIEVNKGSRYFIIHIRDIHSDPEAQIGMGKAIAELAREFPNDLGVLLEGSSGPLSRPFQGESHFSEREKVARRALWRGWITGSEYAVLKDDALASIPVLGLEDEKNYLEDFFLYREASQNQETAGAIISKLHDGIQVLARQNFSKKLLELSEDEQQWLNQKLSWADFFGKYQELYPDYFSHPVFKKYLRILSSEKEMDDKSLTSEVQTAVSRLADNRDSAGTKAFLKKVLRYRLGQLSSGGFITFLARQLRKEGVSPSDRSFSYLFSYAKSARLKHSLNGDELFNQLGKSILEIKKSLAHTDKEKEILELSDKAGLLSALGDLELSQDGWKKWKKTDANIFSGVLSQDEIYLAASLLRPAEEFYEKACLRDASFWKNLNKQMEIEKRPLWIVIAGGFHSGAMEERLKDSGLSYAVASSHIQHSADNEIYKRLMTNEVIQKLPLPKVNQNVSTIVYPLLLGNLSPGVSRWLYQTRLNILRAELLDALEGMEGGLNGPSKKLKLKTKTDTDELKRIVDLFITPKYGYKVAQVLIEVLKERDADEALIRYAGKKADQLLGEVTATQSVLVNLFRRMRLSVVRVLAAAALVLAVPAFLYQTYTQANPPGPSIEAIQAVSTVPQTDEQFRELFPEFRFQGMNTLPEDARRELVLRLEEVLRGPLSRIPSFLLYQAVIIRSAEGFQARFLDGNSISLDGLESDSAVQTWLGQIMRLLRLSYADRSQEIMDGNASDIEDFFGSREESGIAGPRDSNLRRILSLYGENFPDGFERDLIRWFNTEEIEDGPRASERLELLSDVFVYWHLMSNLILEQSYQYEFPRMNIERVGLLSLGQRNALRNSLRNFMNAAGERLPTSVLRLFQIHAVPSNHRDETAYAGMNVNFEARVFLPGDSETEGRSMRVLEEEGFTAELFSRFSRHLFKLGQQPNPSAVHFYPNAAYYNYALSLGRSSSSDRLNIDGVFEIYGNMNQGMELFGQDLNQWLESREVRPGDRQPERARLIEDIFRHWEAMESEEGTFGPGTSLEVLERMAIDHYNTDIQFAAVRQMVHYPFNPDSWRRDAREHAIALIHVAFSDAPERVRNFAIGILADLLNGPRGLASSERVEWDYASYHFNSSVKAMSLALADDPELLQQVFQESHARAEGVNSYGMLEVYARSHLRTLGERDQDMRNMIRWDLILFLFMNLGWSFLNYKDQKHLAYLIKLFLEGLREGYVRDRTLREINKLIGPKRMMDVWGKIKAAVPEFIRFDDAVLAELQNIEASNGNFPELDKTLSSAAHFEGALLYSGLAETGPFIRKRKVLELSEMQVLVSEKLRDKEKYVEHQTTLKRMNADASEIIKEWVMQENRHQEVRVPWKDGTFIVLYVEKEILEHFPENQIKVLLEWALSMDRSLHGTDYKTLTQPIVVGLLDQSPYMMMDHVGNGFIGLNRSIFQVPQGPLRDILFQLGMVHELRHEVMSGQEVSERDFAEKDKALRKELTQGRQYDEKEWCRQLFSVGILDGRSPILRVSEPNFLPEINDVIAGNLERLEKFYNLQILPKAGIGLEELTEDAREVLEEIPIASLRKLVDKLGLNFGAPGSSLNERVVNGRRLFSGMLSRLKLLYGPDLTLVFPRLVEEALKKSGKEHVFDVMVRLAIQNSPWKYLILKNKPLLSFEGAPLNVSKYKVISRFIGKKGVSEISREQKWAFAANSDTTSMIQRFNHGIAEALRLKIQEKGNHETILVEVADQKYLQVQVDKDMIKRWGIVRIEKLLHEAIQMELKENRTNLSALRGPLIMGLLTEAPHLMADHFSNGFIGVHEALFDLPDGIVRDVMFQVGFIHELRHELENLGDKWGDTEEEFLVKDLALKRALLKHHQYDELRWNIQVMYSDVLDVHADILKLGDGYYSELDSGIAGNEQRARHFFDVMLRPMSGISFDALAPEAQKILEQIPLTQLNVLTSNLGLHFGFKGEGSYVEGIDRFSQLLVEIYKLQGYRIYLKWDELVRRSIAAVQKGLYLHVFDGMLDMARERDGAAAGAHYQIGETPVLHEEIVNPLIRNKMENVITHLQTSSRIEKREEAQRVLDLTPLHYDAQEGMLIVNFSKMVNVEDHLLSEAKRFALIRAPGFLGTNPYAVPEIHDILLGLHGVFTSDPDLAAKYRNMRLVINLKDFALGTFAGSHALFHYGSAGRDLPTVYASGPVLLRLARALLDEDMEAENALRGVLLHEWMHSEGKNESDAAAAQKEIDKTEYLKRLALRMLEENQRQAENNLEQSAEYLALRRMVLDGNLVWAVSYLRGLIESGTPPEDIHKMLSKLLSSGEVFQAPALELCEALKDVVDLSGIEKVLIQSSFSAYRRSLLSLTSEIKAYFRTNDSMTIDFKSKTIMLKKPYSGFKTFQIPDSLMEEIETDQRQPIPVDSMERLQDVFESRWMTTAGRKSDVFLQVYIREGALQGIVDPVEKQVLVLDLDLIKKGKSGDLLLELREIIRKLSPNVQVIVIGSEDERNISETLIAEGGLKPADLKRLSIYSYGSQEKGVDEWIVNLLLKEKKADELSEIKFVGTKDNLEHGLYGDYLRSQIQHGLTSVFGDGKNSLAQLVVMVFEAKDMTDLKRVLKLSGFTDEEIQEMMPEDGKLPPLPVAGAFTDSLKQNYQTQRMIEAAA